MNITHSGRQSFRLQQPVVLTTWASVAGKKESEGPLGACFDLTSRDPYFGQKSWEKAEAALFTVLMKIPLSRYLRKVKSMAILIKKEAMPEQPLWLVFLPPFPLI